MTAEYIMVMKSVISKRKSPVKLSNEMTQNVAIGVTAQEVISICAVRGIMMPIYVNKMECQVGWGVRYMSDI